MKQDLGFADAAAIGYQNYRPHDFYTIVIGVEDSTRVRYRPTGNETVAMPETWRHVSTLVGEDLRSLSAIESALPSRGGFFDRIFNISGRLAESIGGDPATLDLVWNFIDSAHRDEDRRLADEVLARDSSWTAGVVATLVLGNFGDEDTAWHRLAGSLTDPCAIVSSVTVSTLEALIRRRKDPSSGPGPATHCWRYSTAPIRPCSGRSCKSWLHPTLTRSSDESWFARAPICSWHTSESEPRMDPAGSRPWLS